MKTLTEALAELGEMTPREIYKHLLAEGVEWGPESMQRAARCPLAMYLRRFTPSAGVLVTWGWAHSHDPYGNSVALPESVSRFVRQVDAGRYGRLERS